MQEQPFDLEGMLGRAGEIARELRRSDAYPAIAGAVAGGIAGALMAIIIAGRATSSRRALPERATSAVREMTEGWTARDVVQLATIVAGLGRQAQEWMASRKRERL